MSVGLACVLAGLCGFISLSSELLWFRVYSFAGEGVGWAFPFFIGVFLLGLALGSWCAVKVFERDAQRQPRGLPATTGNVETAVSSNPLRDLARLLLAANALAFVAVPTYALAATLPTPCGSCPGSPSRPPPLGRCCR